MPNKTFFYVSGKLSALIMLFVFSSLVNAQYEGAKSVPKDWKKGFENIKVDDAKNILGFLAGPDLLGRSPLQPGFAAAAGFAAWHFRELGLKPAGPDGAFLQRFTMTEVRVLPESAGFSSADGALKFEFAKDFTFRVPADFETKKQFVFVRIAKGAESSLPDLSIYKDKIIVFSSDAFTNNRDLVMKAIGAGPNALPFVIPSKSALPDAGAMQRPKDTPAEGENKFTNLRLTEAAANKLADACGAKNYLAADATQTTVETCDKDFNLKAKVSTKDLFETMNVLAKIEGSDPVLKDEAVFLGAHLDHFGTTRGPNVMWGADDDASGVTALMLIANGIMQNPVKPKRTVIIALWSGEELGVLGSRNFVNHPTFPLDKVISYLNLDMVGRNEEDKRFNEKPENNTTSVYTGSVKFNSEDLYKLLYQMNTFVNLRLKDDHEDRILRTDTANFYNRNIPTLKTFTGEHLDYHKATDTPDKINYDKLTNVAKWIYLTTMELSTNPVKPRYEKKPFVAAPNPTN